MELVHKGSKGELVKCGGGKASELWCNAMDERSFVYPV